MRAAIWPVLFVALLGTRQTRASEPLRFHLDYIVDPNAKGCPDRTAFVRETERLVGSVAFDPNAERRIVARIEKTPSGLNGTVSFEASALEARQSFTEASSHCSELASSMALAAAMAIERLQNSKVEVDGEPVAKPSDGEPVEKPLEPGSVPGPLAPEPPRATPPSARPAAPPTPPTKAKLDLSTAANVGLAAGYAPGIRPLASVGLRIGRRGPAIPRSLELGLLSVYPGSAYGSREGRILLELRAATAQPCVGIASWLDTCASATVGAHRARGSGIPNAREQDVFFMALGLRVNGRASIVPGLDLRVRGGVDFPVSRATFRLGEEAVYSVPMIAGLIEAGLSAHLP
ncbi:hypothetical protein AKJ09_01746 [Labilithrix luteola]|uniref:Uncharacterized protein n=1 Tax=Labilithrix luteola TaxID=1391654 RepID=A0A0K1PNJ1_9BACT|nr:hypothetical protein [Labilithrix luteola]AKU95082.1 hypothetical protein AKJ09_01746 [Labilithrix luteola]